MKKSIQKVERSSSQRYGSYRSGCNDSSDWVDQEFCEEEQEEKNVESVECEICCEVFTVEKNSILSDNEEVVAIPDCSHRFCFNCVSEYLNHLIFSSNVLNIRCPSDGCSTELKEEFIKKLLPKEIFDKYVNFKRNQIIGMNPNYRWCVRPDCERYMIGDAENPKMECECGQQFCFKCRSAWHEGLSW